MKPQSKPTDVEYESSESDAKSEISNDSELSANFEKKPKGDPEALKAQKQLTKVINKLQSKEDRQKAKLFDRSEVRFDVEDNPIITAIQKELNLQNVKKTKEHF